MTQVKLEKEDDNSIFEEIVEEDPGVCNNCFRRTHEVEEDWYPEQEDLVKKGYDSHFHTMQGPEREEKFASKRFTVLGQNTEKVYPRRKNAKGSPKGRNICENCGIIDRGVRFRPVSKSEAISYTQNLAERLEEEDIDFDEDILFSCVRKLKSRPDHQSADDDIFESSIKVAVELPHE